MGQEGGFFFLKKYFWHVPCLTPTQQGGEIKRILAVKGINQPSGCHPV